MSRIPYPLNDTNDALYSWWRQMADLGLAFHPDDDPNQVIASSGDFLFSRAEARQLTAIIDELHSTHGDEIYKAALWATEAPDITAARQDAIATWDSQDISVPPHAEVEKVDGGYWISAQVWVSNHD